jgi:hypothetical protein
MSKAPDHPEASPPMRAVNAFCPKVGSGISAMPSRRQCFTMPDMSIIAVPARFRRALDIGFVAMAIIGLIVALVHDFAK